MAVALLVFLGLLAVAGIVMWVLAIRISYRVEQQRDGDKSRRALAMTNMFRSAFWAPVDDKADPILRRKLQTYIYAALGCMIVMAAASFALPVLAVQEKAAKVDAPPAPIDPTGTTLDYIRSNQDGTLPERVIVHVVSPTEVHVAKMIAACTDAAYVTAVFDPATQEATRLVGGRLNREGGQTPGVYLDFNPPTRVMEVRFGDPDSQPAETHTAPPAPWRMYDFDLAEFALFGPRETEDFSFGFAMAWPDGTSPALRILGDVKADFLYSSDKGARNHFRIAGAAFTDPIIGDRGGELVTDAIVGNVIEARFGRPNHTGYANFQLKLIAATPAPEGDAVWRKALTDHWANCPAEAADQ
jgi:hypothetical protein